MLGILYFVVAILSVYLLIRHFGSTVFRSGVESLAVAAPVAIAGVSLLGSAAAIFFTTKISAEIALISLFIPASLLTWKSRKTFRAHLWPKWDVSKQEKIWSTIIILFLGLFLSFLTVSTLHQNSDKSTIIPKQASVDVAYHLSQVMRVAESSSWNFQEPNFAGEFIRYPYLINFFSGVLMQFGTPLSLAFHLPIIFLTFSLLFGLLQFAQYLGVNKLNTTLVLLAVFFGSGVAYLLGYDFNAGPLAVTYPQQHINYTGYVSGFFTVQRAFVLGFPLLIFSLLAFFRGLKEDNLTALRWAGLIFGLLPLAHSHSFFTGGIIYGVVLVYYIARRNPMAFDIVRGTVFFGTFTAIVPLLCMMLLPQHNLGGVPALRLGWMTNPSEIGGLNLPSTLTNNSAATNKLVSWLMFVLGNFGTLLLLPIFGLLAVFKKVSKHISELSVAILLSGLALWIVPNIVQLQTWDFDTNKFFVYAILLSGLATALLIQSFTGKSRAVLTIVFAAAILASLPVPFMKLQRMAASETKQTVTAFTLTDQEASTWIHQNTPEQAIFLSSAANANSEQTLLNSVVMGSGRQTSIGYITWLYTHGINYEDRLQKVEKFFQTGDPKELGDTPADYLVLDNMLRKRFPNLENNLSQNKLAPIYTQSEISIYKLK